MSFCEKKRQESASKQSVSSEQEKVAERLPIGIRSFFVRQFCRSSSYFFSI